MALVFENKDRRVIPNWRSFNTTTILGELDSALITPRDGPILNIDSYIDDFTENESVPYAADLISSSIVNGFEDNEEVKRAAKFILTKQESVTYSQYSVAKRIIQGVQEKTERKIDEITITELSNCLPIWDYRTRIRDLKIQVIEFPYNPILWVELSRCYSILGHEKQSIRAMKMAVQLAPENRFVLRCAVRLFSRYSDLELAHDIVRRKRITSFDPWLTSAEIAIATLRGRNSKFIKKGVELLYSNNFSPFSTTELASSLATVELLSGGRKKSKDLFSKSLLSPNDNSLAQIEWVLNEKDKTLFDRSQINVFTNHSFEAQALSNFHNKKLVDALNNTCQWFCDMPFSKSPIMLGSHISSILGQNHLSIKFLESGLISHPNDAQMLNNIAYYLALDNKTKEASIYLKKINLSSEVNKLTEICLTATKGLIHFREKEFDEGRNAYLSAIEKAKTENDRHYIWTAILNYAREEILAQTDQVDFVMKLVSLVPENEDLDYIVRKLRLEVMDLYEKVKMH